MNKMKYIKGLFLIGVMVCLMSSCFLTKECSYDKGYEDGYNSALDSTIICIVGKDTIICNTAKELIKH